jgi:hypothetical protein
MPTRPCLALVAIVLTSGAAFAASPHFVSASATIGNGGALTVGFKEAGLGANQNIDYVAHARLAAEWACINKGGKNPTAANKRTISSAVTKPGSFSSGKNGSVSASIDLGAPAKPPAEEFSCPSGQTLVLASVSYSSVRIEDKTNNVSKSVPDASKTLMTLQ